MLEKRILNGISLSALVINTATELFSLGTYSTLMLLLKFAVPLPWRNAG
jgi:hypothetical protein